MVIKGNSFSSFLSVLSVFKNSSRCNYGMDLKPYYN